MTSWVSFWRTRAQFGLPDAQSQFPPLAIVSDADRKAGNYRRPGKLNSIWVVERIDRKI